MNKEARTLANIKQFLSRVQLAGAEVPAFVEAVQYIDERLAEIDRSQSEQEKVAQ